MATLRNLFGALVLLMTFSFYLSFGQESNSRILIEVRDKVSNALLPSATIKIKSGSDYSEKVQWVSPSYSWKHDGFKSYTFDTSSKGYNSEKIKLKVKDSTKLITLVLSKNSTNTTSQPFCGDGICNGDETADTSSFGRCFDCGRIRGVVSLAVGQKVPLSDIKVSVWADPVNPALFLRNGSVLPTPSYKTYTDSKGYFVINTLSFDAPIDKRGKGQSKRRFYFSLEGVFTERSGGFESVTALLPLWWNFELTNSEPTSVGTLMNSNQSPTLYFYMTPPFSPSEAVMRVILSWGTLNSNPSGSIPDLDLVVAGPVEPQSIQVFGTGIINFQTQTSSNGVLPFARLITDSTQGFGPEVMDFYAKSPSTSLSLGFSSTYAPGALANVYELWVDRPNSSPNMDSAFSFLFDTNSFIVVYQNDGTSGGNKQVLFDQITNVPFAFGFYNGDQWNKIPRDATLWHVFDLTQVAPGFVFTGFPGQNETSGGTSSQPGAKYGYDGQFFEPSKTIPCGHVSERGANPAYCPGKLTYPQI